MYNTYDGCAFILYIAAQNWNRCYTFCICFSKYGIEGFELKHPFRQRKGSLKQKSSLINSSETPNHKASRAMRAFADSSGSCGVCLTSYLKTSCHHHHYCHSCYCCCNTLLIFYIDLVE